MKGKIGLVAGRGIYPLQVLDGARTQGVSLVVAAFTGETEARVAARGQPTEWLRVGQLGKLISFFKKAGVREAIFAGQITPKRLFDLRPDWKALWILARLKEKNAATLFGAVAGVGQSGHPGFTGNDFYGGAFGRARDFGRAESARASFGGHYLRLAPGQSGGQAEYRAKFGGEAGNGDGGGGL